MGEAFLSHSATPYPPLCCIFRFHVIRVVFVCFEVHPRLLHDTSETCRNAMWAQPGVNPGWMWKAISLSSHCPLIPVCPLCFCIHCDTPPRILHLPPFLCRRLWPGRRELFELPSATLAGSLWETKGVPLFEFYCEVSHAWSSRWRNPCPPLNPQSQSDLVSLVNNVAWLVGKWQVSM